MLKIKISVGWHQSKPGIKPYNDNLNIFNFTNTKDNVFNNKKYYINSQIENPDYWFVLENTKSNNIEKTNMKSNNVYFLNSETRYEPSFFLKKSKAKFLNQFKGIYTPNYTNSRNSESVPPFLSWKLRGDPFEINEEVSDIEYYKNFYPNKNQLISVYCTNKQITEIQKVRLDFVKKLKNILGDRLHWYGTDIKTKNKIDGIAPYKYHLVIENQIANNFISEKIYDSFLGNSLPIYAGSPNINEFFSKKSVKSINLNDFNSSVETILNCINGTVFEDNFNEIVNSRNIVLENFNLIKRIDKIVDNLEYLEQDKTISMEKYIYPKIHFENRSLFARLSYSINKRLKKLSKYLESQYS